MTTDPAVDEQTESSRDTAEDTSSEADVRGSNYDIIRDRLADQAAELRNRADTLNDKRQEIFGGTELSVAGQVVVRTEHNCVPRDIIDIGDHLLFGYNVYIGMKKSTDVEDVFSFHAFEKDGDDFEIEPMPEDHDENFLGQEEFVDDFESLYNYYGDVRLVQLQRTDSRLMGVFQTGTTLDDIRVLRWALDSDDDVDYIDNSGRRDLRTPSQHDFEWRDVTRDDHVQGRYPHICVLDEVFVDCTDGELTIKVEDNTEAGKSIHREPVEDPHQSLGDAEVQFSQIDNLILMRILPYREDDWRYFVFNSLTEDVWRIDAIGQSCVILPEDHGVIFPGGYVLSEGPMREFDVNIDGMRFQEMVRSANGEDFLYVFYRPEEGSYLLLSYNVIRKEIENPIDCHGYSLFGDGMMVVFRLMNDEATRVHPMQIWQTPYYDDEHAAKKPEESDSRLVDLGNAELVRGISDLLGLCRMIDDLEPSETVYEALIKAAQTLLDNYFWLEEDEVGAVDELVTQIIDTAELVVEEFIKVRSMKQEAEKRLAEAEDRHSEVLLDTRFDDWSRLERFVDALGDLREHRGRLITLHDVRYIDDERLDELEEEVVEHYDDLTEATVEFLLGDEALDPYHERLTELETAADEFETTKEGEELGEELDEVNEDLTLLTDVVSNLEIDDPTRRTEILDDIGALLGRQNQVRAGLENRISKVRQQEGKAEFAVQFQLLDQTVNSALGMADTPEACDERLSRVLSQLEELESRFSEFDEYMGKLTEKREEIYEAFESRKQTLLDQRQRRAQRIVEGAERVLDNVQRRAAVQDSVEDLNAFFASDQMIMRIREQIEKLRDLGEGVAADDLQTQLAQVEDESVRELRDKADLFGDEDDVIELGRHKFSIGDGDPELTAIPRGGTMMLHITGTEFFEPVDDPNYQKTERFWDQPLVSETDDVYRSEFLAASLLFEAEAGEGELSIDKLREMKRSEDGLSPLIDGARTDRYDEGYERGVHDEDAEKILSVLLDVYKTAGLMRFTPQARAAASLFWAFSEDERRDRWARQSVSLGRLREIFGHDRPLDALGEELAEAIDAFVEARGLRREAEANSGSLGGRFTEARCREAGHYLAQELVDDDPVFAVNAESADLRDAFMDTLEKKGKRIAFEEDLAEVEQDLSSGWELVEAWLRGFVNRDIEEDVEHVLPEAVGLLIVGDRLDRKTSEVRTNIEVDDLRGRHPRIDDGALNIRFDAFLTRLREYIDEHVPAWRDYRSRTHELVEREADRLDVDELEPQVMSGFVRNQLIDEVYLDIVGDNLATQMGTAGDSARAERSGLLFLISPPGYGKTTLMEYIASRLGVMFVRVNGPSLGHDVTSLDPAEAPSATARQELEKLNFAFEMGNNVMLYVDDVQHVSPEFLQQFISLCDATRRVDGVWNGESKTYDLRGKRFSVVMGGNPYTESGEKFRIPDMLANRADIYNLGDILSGNRQAFERSYIENALTSNETTAPLVGRDSDDIDRFIRMAEGAQIPLTEMSHDYASVEANQIVEVLKKMLRVRDVVLAVNQEYIRSAGQDDDYRTEPPFLLQGSYRNMGSIVERIVPAMNEEELAEVIDDHYRNEAQTLTTGAEANLLKLAELRGTMDDEQKQRWKDLKRDFQRQKMMGGGDEDPVARVAGPLATLVQRVEDVQGALDRRELDDHLGDIHRALEKLAETDGVKAVPASAVDSEANGRSPHSGEAVEQVTEALGNGEIRVDVGGDVPQKLEQVLETQLGLIESAIVPLARALHRHFDSEENATERLGEVLDRLEQLQTTSVE